MADMACDVAVVGLGAMGSAALWQLSRRGYRVCGIDRFRPPHSLGSSHGAVRAIRKAYFEHPDYVPLLNRAYEGWRELEAESGVPLLNLCGMLFAGDPASEAMQGLERCYAEHVLPHERWTAAEAEGHFPQFLIEPHHEVFWDPLGGYVRAEETVEQCLRLAMQHGATTLFDEPVVSWGASSGGCEVRTQGHVIRSQSLVITAGPWTAPLLRDLAAPLSVLRKVQLWYGGGGAEAFGEGFPVWYMDKPYGGIYGFPAVGGDGMKVAEHTGGEETASPEELDRGLHAQDEQKILRCLGETFPRFVPHLGRYSVCMYTMTPDHHFVIDRHPEHGNVVIGAGFSGHGFKFAPVVGEVLADLATLGTTAHPVQFHSLGRFG